MFTVFSICGISEGKFGLSTGRELGNWLADCGYKLRFSSQYGGLYRWNVIGTKGTGVSYYVEKDMG